MLIKAVYFRLWICGLRHITGSMFLYISIPFKSLQLLCRTDTRWSPAQGQRSASNAVTMWYASECWAYRTTPRRFLQYMLHPVWVKMKSFFFVELFWNNMYGVIGERQHHKSAVFKEFKEFALSNMWKCDTWLWHNYVRICLYKTLFHAHIRR